MSRRSRTLIVTVLAVAVLTGAATVAIRSRTGTEHSTTATPPTSATDDTAPLRTAGATGWVTSESGESLMAALSVATQPADDETVVDLTIDPATTFQTIDGFGAAMTHSSAELLAAMPADRRYELLTELFAPHGPVRLSYLRIPIGASDFVSGDAFTFDDVPPGETDWNLERFSIDPDRAHLIPILDQALDLNPDLTIIASPWSPPAWLKTTGTLQGGRLLDQPDAYRTYADYLVRFIQDYRAAGIPIDAITVQNEPQQRHPDGYPGTDMPVYQQVHLIETLGPALRDANLATAILGFDHNWSLHPADAATTPDGEDPSYQYPADVLRSTASPWLAGTAFHCYAGDAAAQTDLHEEFPEKGIWVTECSGSHSVDDAPGQIFAQTLAWQSVNLLLGSLRHWARAVLTWNIALDETGGPHVGGCTTCTGVVTIHPDGTITRNAEYYVLAHASRFISSGAVRISSESNGDLPVVHVVFRHPDGSTVLIAYNSSDDATSLSIGDRALVTTTTVPAQSLITIVWPASGPDRSSPASP